jgi:hypothetical protein
MAGKKGKIPPQFLANIQKAKGAGNHGAEIAKHAKAAAQHLGQIAKLSGKK